MKLIVLLVFLLPFLFAFLGPVLGFNPAWPITLSVFIIFMLVTVFIGWRILLGFVESLYHETNIKTKIALIILVVILVSLFLFRALTLPISINTP